MLIALVTSLLIAASQTDALFTRTMPPPDIPTFEVTMSGEEPFFAGIQISGQWVTDHRTEIEPTQTIVFFVDSPFYGAAPFSVTRRRVELRYEPPAMRRARLENLWTSNGYTFLETAAGWQPVREQDILLAERARKMTETAQEKTTAQFSVAKPFGAQEPENTLSPQFLLILRVAIILSGILAGVIALKLIFRKNAEWKALE